MKDLIWYACYGSNLKKSNFLDYIQKCSDKSTPRDDKQYRLPYELYFSISSEKWDYKGVSFIKLQKAEHTKTLGRIYLIKKEQFNEIVGQESIKRSNDTPINIDFEETISKGYSLIPEIKCYARIIYIGSEEGYPIFTFTARWDDENIGPKPPGKRYLKEIIEGIKETYDLQDEEIIEYLKNIEGIKGRICEEQIIKIVKQVSLP